MKSILLLLIAIAILPAQGRQDWRLPVQRGTTIPSQCTAPRIFIKTDATAGANVYACVNGVYVLQGSFAMFNWGSVGAGLSPADGTTYYLAGFDALVATSSAGGRRLYMSLSGTITTCSGLVIQAAGASSETSSIYLRVNNTTDYLISSSVANNNGTAGNAFSGTEVNAPISVGDFIEIKWVAPTWATNPTQVMFTGTCAIRTS